MRDDPDTRDLIATAREALKADILPRLEGDAVYAGAMVANALGIALRDLEDAAEAGAEAERDALRRLLGDAAGDLSELNAAFAAAIRAGRFDPGTEAHADARRILWSQSSRQAVPSGPEAAGGGAAGRHLARRRRALAGERLTGTDGRAGMVPRPRSGRAGGRCRPDPMASSRSPPPWLRHRPARLGATSAAGH